MILSRVRIIIIGKPLYLPSQWRLELQLLLLKNRTSHQTSPNLKKVTILANKNSRKVPWLKTRDKRVSAIRKQK